MDSKKQKAKHKENATQIEKQLQNFDAFIALGLTEISQNGNELEALAFMGRKGTVEQKVALLDMLFKDSPQLFMAYILDNGLNCEIDNF